VPHGVPSGDIRQLPVPLHVPSRPQTEEVVGQSLGWRGLAPLSSETQTPSEPSLAQVRQPAPQASLQQYPSTQNPLEQSAAHPQC
jgi:hypothetical protein